MTMIADEPPMPSTAARPPASAVPAAAVAVLAAVLVAVAALLPAAPAAAQPPPAFDAAAWEAVLAWPEEQRAFLQDGPGWLLGEAERAELLAMDERERGAWIEGFLSNPAFAAAVAVRRELAFAAFASPTDVRARLLFLHGPPAERLVVDCGLTFGPLEIWTWGDPQAAGGAGGTRSAVVYEDGAAGGWRLWLPRHGKRVLYTRQMEHWLEDWEELVGGGVLRARRFDLQVCRETRRVDRVTGVRGLTDADPDRPSEEDFLALLAPPDDLAAWTRQALAGVPPPPPALEVSAVETRFPARDAQRVTAALVVTLPPGAAEAAARETAPGGGADPAATAAAGGAPEEAVAPAADGDDDPGGPAASAAERELRLVAEGVVEHQGRVFETFRVRFRPEAPAAGQPVVLVVDRELRPEARYLLRLTLRDEVSGRAVRLARALAVPAEPRPEDAALLAAAERPQPLPAAVHATLVGADHLLLVPPQEGVVLGLWRAEALVAGPNIVRVEFLVDGEVQLARSRPPYTAELRLDATPREQVIAVVGYDARGDVIARDEVVVNEPRGALRVRIVEPPPDAAVDGRATVRAEVTVPAERRVDRLELSVNEELVATLARPPWQAEVELPPGDGPVVLTAAVWLDDGTRAEHVRVLNAPGYREEVEVSLVELYVAAVDRQNRLVEGLAEGDFRVLEDGRPQTVSRFEEVRDMPLVLGLVLDVSGSMQSTLAAAERAAVDFLRSVARPGDLSFALAFANYPMLLVPPTDDAEAVADALSGRQAFGGTALHDAVVTALYSFRGFEGQKALILFSDGDDTASDVPFADALEYARRMNVSIYPIGFGVGLLDVPLRRKLDELATSTGGRSFYASDAGELDAVYESIEAELRTRYLLAYAPERPAGEEGGDGGGFRRVEVEIARPGVSARTIRGYYP